MKIVVVGSKDISEYEKPIKEKLGDEVVIVGEDVTIVGNPKLEEKLQSLKNIPYKLTMIPFDYIPPPCKKHKGYERPYKYHK